MIVHQQHIRLTEKELQDYYSTTGRVTPPKTVQEYNRAMREAYQAWAATDCAEGQLLAEVFCKELEV